MGSNVQWHQLPNNTHPRWYKDAGLRQNVAFGLGLCLVIAVNGYQASLLGGFQAMPSWQTYFKHPTGGLLGIYAASFFLPSIVTSFVGDYLSTKLGRRWCIIIANLILIIGALVNTFTVSIGMWCAGKLLSPLMPLIADVKSFRSCHHGRGSRNCEGRRSSAHPGNQPSSTSTHPWLLLSDFCLHWRFLCRLDDL